ncbi:MAG: hypothetical protein U5L01_06155 [Rheinheimera sp.]|nr:hypothetical protein [Rheinheimera sp.]
MIILTIKTASSVEVVNTDAEGRLVLADGLLMRSGKVRRAVGRLMLQR